MTIEQNKINNYMICPKSCVCKNSHHVIFKNICVIVVLLIEYACQVT